MPLLREGIGLHHPRPLSDSKPESERRAGGDVRRVPAEERQAGGRSIVSCPRCGRASFDTHAFTARWAESAILPTSTATVAVMGCVVNGPGEARHADLGITGAGDWVIIFRKGEIARTISPEEADTVFEEELDKLE